MQQTKVEMAPSLPDNLTRDERLEPGSARNFGLVMAAFFLIVAIVGWWGGSSNWWRIWLPVSAAFALLAGLRPALLDPLNYLWFRLGLLLHKVVSPVMMGLIFFGAILPVGSLMRICGRRPLAPSFDPDASTYWTERPRAAQPGPMSKQY
jgi:hypothetical protein